MSVLLLAAILSHLKHRMHGNAATAAPTLIAAMLRHAFEIATAQT
jgi:hypothetical protein